MIFVHERHCQSRCLLCVGIVWEAEEGSESFILNTIKRPSISCGVPYAKNFGSGVGESIQRGRSLGVYRVDKLSMI